MVGLYNDPKGETVTTFHTTVARDEAETANTGKNNDSELKKLRRRVIELENSIKKQVRYLGRVKCIRLTNIRRCLVCLCLSVCLSVCSRSSCFSISNQRYSRVSLRLFLGFDSWIFKKKFQKLWREKANMQIN